MEAQEGVRRAGVLPRSEEVELMLLSASSGSGSWRRALGCGYMGACDGGRLGLQTARSGLAE